MKKIIVSSGLFIGLCITSLNINAQHVIPGYNGSPYSTTIGSANAGWSHIQTNAPKFYFSKPIAVHSGQFGAYYLSNLSFATGVSGYSGFGTTRMTILKSNGNVGIGTTNPLAKLDVNGNIKIGSNHDIIIRDANHGLGWYGSGKPFAGVNNIDGPVLYGYGGGALGVVRGGTQMNVLNWHANGNVGIGTTKVSGYKLSVEGKVRAREIEVNALTWADFVFEDKYNLAPLAEVEEYIEANNHLPNVPSEKEVLEDGINLGEMDAILLRKIEELTLYMIDLKKENEESALNMIGLKKENKELRQLIERK